MAEFSDQEIRVILESFNLQATFIVASLNLVFSGVESQEKRFVKLPQERASDLEQFFVNSCNVCSKLKSMTHDSELLQEIENFVESYSDCFSVLPKEQKPVKKWKGNKKSSYSFTP